jgi:hypothetical protein
MTPEEEIRHLKEQVKKLKEEKDSLAKEKDSLERAFEKTKREFEEFKSLHATTVDNLKQALKIKANSKIVSKPLGAPLGHKGYTRNIPERIDVVKELNPCKCPYCKTILGNTQEIRTRYVTDIKLKIDTINTQYNIHRKYCTECKKIVESPVPNVLPHARFGLNLMLLVMYLKLSLRLSNQKVCEYFSTMSDLKISDGEISIILKQLAREYGDYYKYLEKLIIISRVKHTDSTSWRINGKNYFAWAFITAGTVIYKISKRNNHKVALAFLKKQKGNILVVDRHSAFRTLAEKSGFLLQLCWSHILADTKDLAKNFGSEGKYVHTHLKEIYALAKMLEHKGTEEEIEQLKGEILQLTLRHYKHITIRRFVDNLYFRDSNNLFRFVNDPEIDATNNISERELRSLVIIRKISNGSKNTRGANATAMLLSIIQTIKLRKENILRELQEILQKPSGY